jgi:hypothetical protein
VVNPVERIVAARRRLKQIAALRAGLALFIPALTALVLAAMLGAIGAATWERVGYVLAPARLGGVRIVLLIAGVAALAACALMALRAFREADDLMDAAERVDEAGKSLRWRASPALPNLLCSARSRRLCSRCYGAAPPAISNDSIRASRSLSTCAVR